MNEGSAVIGFLILVGLVMHFGWPAALIICVPLAFDLILGRVLLPLLRGIFSMIAHGLSIQGRRQRLQYLSELDKRLRQGSQGFALCVLAVLAAVAGHVWFFGWGDFAGVLSRPVEFWPLLVLAVLFVIGAVRFCAGASRSAGARDTMIWFWGAVRLGLGAAALFYLTRKDLLGQVVAMPAGIYAFAAVFASALWLALIGFMRVVLLSWPRGRARVMAGRYIDQSEFSWNALGRRRWWQFWKRRNR